MTKLAKPPLSGAGLMRRTFGGDLMPAPLARDVFLIQVDVAGTGFASAGKHLDRLSPGVELVLRREPGNPHDSLAILVELPDRVKLGYVPRAHNEVLARLMDAGKRLLARVERVVPNGDWPRIAIDVSMRDV